MYTWWRAIFGETPILNHYCRHNFVDLPKTKNLLTLEIITLPIHEDVIHQDDTEDARPQVQVTKYENESNVLTGEGELTFILKINETLKKVSFSPVTHINSIE